jgi:oligosaccharyltransferase complex subunit gamma
MRFILAALTALAAAGLSFAEKKSSEQRFNEFCHLARSSPALKLNVASYNSLTATPRDYTAAVLLTALDTRFGCQLCREFQPEWDLVAKSWSKGDRAGESRLLFGTLDFAEGRDVFLSVRRELAPQVKYCILILLQLGLSTAPVLLLFPPTDGPHAAHSQEPLRYDFTSGYVEYLRPLHNLTI